MDKLTGSAVRADQDQILLRIHGYVGFWVRTMQFVGCTGLDREVSKLVRKHANRLTTKIKNLKPSYSNHQ